MESCLFFNGYNRYIVQHKIFFIFRIFHFFWNSFRDPSTGQDRPRHRSDRPKILEPLGLVDPDFRGLFFLRRTALSKLATTQGLPNGPGIVQVQELSVDMVSVRLEGFGFGAMVGRSQGPGAVSVEVYSGFSFLGFGERILLATSASVYFTAHRTVQIFNIYGRCRWTGRTVDRSVVRRALILSIRQGIIRV